MGSLQATNSSKLSELSRQKLSYKYRVYASFCSKDRTQKASNWIECYDPSNHSWERVTSIPELDENHVRKDFSMVAVNENIYVIGGRLCSKVAAGGDADYAAVNETSKEVLQSVLCYNVHTETWSKCAPLSVPRFDFACTVSDNKIYVAGGQTTLFCARGVASAEVYDPALDEWKCLPDMSTSRYKCVGVTWQGKIHVVGGFAGGGVSDSPGPFVMERSSAEAFDTERRRWDFMARMWELDIPPNQIVAVDGGLFSSGDCYKAWKGHIEAFDGNLKIWNVVDGSQLESLSSPESNWPSMERIYLTMAPIGTELFFLVGYKMPGEIPRLRSEVHVFDVSENRWRSFEATEEEGEKELCCHCCVLKEEP